MPTHGGRCDARRDARLRVTLCHPDPTLGDGVAQAAGAWRAGGVAARRRQVAARRWQAAAWRRQAAQRTEATDWRGSAPAGSSSFVPESKARSPCPATAVSV